MRNLPSKNFFSSFIFRVIVMHTEISQCFRIYCNDEISMKRMS